MLYIYLFSHCEHHSVIADLYKDHIRSGSYGEKQGTGSDPSFAYVDERRFVG